MFLLDFIILLVVVGFVLLVSVVCLLGGCCGCWGWGGRFVRGSESVDNNGRDLGEEVHKLGCLEGRENLKSFLGCF